MACDGAAILPLVSLNGIFFNPRQPWNYVCFSMLEYFSGGGNMRMTSKGFKSLRRMIPFYNKKHR